LANVGEAMCLVCKDWLQGKLTADEAYRNLDEAIGDSNTYEEYVHFFEVMRKISEDEKSKK